MLGSFPAAPAARVAVALAMVSLVAIGTAVSAQSPAPMSPALTADGAWARVSPMMERAGAAYLVIHNTGTTDEALVSVTSPDAAVVELHETKDDGTGQMTMAPVASIPVPAGGTAELKPGSFHLMLIDLVALEAGSVVDLVLTFGSGATLAVAAPVGDGPAPMSPALTADGAWARVSPMMERAGAVYLVIHNTGTTDEALVSVTSPDAAVVELHETKDDGTGQMTMAPVASIPVPAGGTAELKPGSFHLMLIDLVAPLEAGSVVDLVLTFGSGATLAVAAPVGDGPAPMSPAG